MKPTSPVRKVLEMASSRWWFVPLFVLPQLIPPYTSRSYDLFEWGQVNAFILTHSIQGYLRDIYLVFQVLPLLLVVVLASTGKRFRRLFGVYVGLSFVLMAFLQNLSISERYGFSACVANVVTFLMLAGLWLWDALYPRSDLHRREMPVWRYLALPLALVAFWFPVNPINLTPDFNPIHLVTSGSGLSFCLTTPLYLAALIVYYPRVNEAVFLVTGCIGVMLGIGNLVLEFVMYPALWWIGILHLPLLAISLYCVMTTVGSGLAQMRLGKVGTSQS